ncbi:MAG TPA: D-tyrosyl-tRNA(Tyr) deacylase [Bacteroidetes bacterium]|nr:D-tyrosyl-tRNA(Tyr) deacylase [Bacteroidota bacterium]
MRALIQRVSRCTVTIDGEVKGSIDRGLLVLLGIKQGDSPSDAKYLADRCAALRIFEDEQQKMNLSVKDIGGEAMVVSQFTLYGDTRKGNRPSFTEAATLDVAENLYEQFVHDLQSTLGREHVKTGMFRAMMNIELVNDGPVTLMIESKQNP